MEDDLGIMDWGLKQEHLQSLSDPDESGRVARVVLQAGHQPHVWLDGARVVDAGKLSPLAGDFVLLDRPAASTPRIERILPRLTLLARRSAGGLSSEQGIASNVDVVGVVEPLDRAPNLRRIERGILLARAAGAEPLVILTKADTHDDVAAVRTSVKRVVGELEIVSLSAVDGLGLDELEAVLPRAATGVLLGASGVGKSTLINALVGEEVMSTREVRAFDKKGRHTTTSRHLFRLPWGAMLIDTPGTRELGVVVDQVALDETFSEIEAFADSCRYRDCTHESEPGCAVQRAVAEGTIAEERFASFRKLRREMRSLEERQRPTDHLERAKGRRFGRLIKEMKRVKKK
jgi:ribosome biogenesis GTPase